MENAKNFIVKIDDEYKYFNNYLINDLKKLLSLYYPDNFSDIYTIDINYHPIFKLITNSNNFIKNNSNLDISNIIHHANLLTSSINFFDNLTNSTFFIYNPDLSANLSLKSFNNSSEPHIFPTFFNNNIIDLEEKHKNFKGEILDINSDFNYDNDPNSNFSGVAPFDNNLIIYGSVIQYFNIYYNVVFNNIFIISSLTDRLSNVHIKDSFSEFVFIIKCTIDDKKKLNLIENEIFVDLNEATNKINNLINKNEINFKPSIDEIKDILYKSFSIDHTNKESSLKFSDIIDSIFLKFHINDTFKNYFKRQLPVILEDLKLSKKRMADGIYYFGISKLTSNTSNNLPFSPKVITFDELLNERTKFDNELKLLPPIL